MSSLPPPSPDQVVRRSVDHQTSIRADRRWWDAEAQTYYGEHGEFLGDTDLVWGPEGWTESQLGLLGDLRNQRVLEVGAGAAQGSRWCAAQGAEVLASDLSAGMLRVGVELDQRLRSGLHPHQERPVTHSSAPTPDGYLQCDGAQLPLPDASFDVVFSAHGVLAFIPDAQAALTEWARVLRPGGRCVFSLPHPLRWALPDSPGEEGLVIRSSYFDRRGYVEQTAGGQVTYVEHHRTMGDLVDAVIGAGLTLQRLVEPEWPEGAEHVWGGWSPTRGRLIPGTLIVSATRPEKA